MSEEYNVKKISSCLLCVCLAVMTFLSGCSHGGAESIELGDTQERVIEVMGEPLEEESTATSYAYFGKNYMDILEKEEELGEKLLSANETQFEKILEEMMKLEEKLASLRYEYTRITFQRSADGVYRVNSVFYDPEYYEEKDNSGKEVKKVELTDDHPVGYYFDQTVSNDHAEIISYRGDEAVKYVAKYTDGSFYKAYMYNSEAELNGEEEAKIKWSDRYASYELVKEAVPIGTVTSDGGWTTNYHRAEVISFTIPANVRYLKPLSIRGEKLEKLVVPETVTSLRDGTLPGGIFDYKNNLSEIYFNANLDGQPGTENGVYVGPMYYPFQLDHGEYSGSAYSTAPSLKIFVGDNVTMLVHRGLFAKMPTLTEIVIPNSVTEFGPKLFAEDINLTKITYLGTIEEWNAIEKYDWGEGDLFWDADTGNYTVYCTNGTIAKNGTETRYPAE